MYKIFNISELKAWDKIYYYDTKYNEYNYRYTVSKVASDLSEFKILKWTLIWKRIDYSDYVISDINYYENGVFYVLDWSKEETLWEWLAMTWCILWLKYWWIVWLFILCILLYNG